MDERGVGWREGAIDGHGLGRTLHARVGRDNVPGVGRASVDGWGGHGVGAFYLAGGKKEASEGFWSSMVFAGNSNPILRTRIARKRFFFRFGWHWSERG